MKLQSGSERRSVGGSSGPANLLDFDYAAELGRQQERRWRGKAQRPREKTRDSRKQRETSSFSQCPTLMLCSVRREALDDEKTTQEAGKCRNKPACPDWGLTREHQDWRTWLRLCEFGAGWSSGSELEAVLPCSGPQPAVPQLAMQQVRCPCLQRSDSLHWLLVLSGSTSYVTRELVVEWPFMHKHPSSFNILVHGFLVLQKTPRHVPRLQAHLDLGLILRWKCRAFRGKFVEYE